MPQIPRVRRRLRLEVFFAGLAFFLSVITLVYPTWIELTTGMDPDHGSGSLEVVITIAALCVSVALTACAYIDWTRLRVASSA